MPASNMPITTIGELQALMSAQGITELQVNLDTEWEVRCTVEAEEPKVGEPSTLQFDGEGASLQEAIEKAFAQVVAYWEKD